VNTTNCKCQNCKYYQQLQGQIQGQEKGTCHIRPPQVVTVIDVKGVGTPGTGWPVVGANSWCGEFKEKKDGQPSPEVINTIKQALSKQIH